MNNCELNGDKKICGNCNKQFRLLNGRWQDALFVTTCPNCKATLATQTRWFELPTIEQMRKRIESQR